MNLRLGDVLVEKGILTPEQRDQIVVTQQVRPRPFGELAEEMFGISPWAVEGAWAEQYGRIAPQVDPVNEQVDPEALDQIDRRQAWQFALLPLHFNGPELVICTTTRHLVRALRFVGWRVQIPCFLVISQPDRLNEALEKHYPMDGMSLDLIQKPNGLIRPAC